MPQSVIIPLSLLSALACNLIAVKYLQILQLEGYRARGYCSWCVKKGGDCVLAGLLCACVTAILCRLFKFAFTILPLLGVAFYLIYYKIPCKVSLKLTKRMARLMLSVTIVNFILSALAFYVSAYIFAVIVGLQPIIVLVCACITMPIESKINARYRQMAKLRLEKINPIKIAITGSYGKTTTKSILTKMLEQEYSVCSTPLSYNTPLGVIRTVNDNLSEQNKILIVEMGARRLGDVEELTRLIMPDLAVITAVGNQHLETFGSIENVAKAKYELIENLPCGGVAFFNGDNHICKDFYSRYGGNKVITGRAGKVWYDNVVMGASGMSFDMHYDSGVQKMTTKLLGSHIPSLICLCASVALNLSVPINKIKNAVNSLQPVAHRLQIIYNVSDVIIDDSYNSNQQGFISALEVLSYYSYLIKVIITPGVVELGDQQYQINRSLGEKSGQVCDYVIVLGENSKALKQGATDAGLEKSRIFEAKNMEGAVEFYKKIMGGKAVLFENDLPDNY